MCAVGRTGCGGVLPSSAPIAVQLPRHGGVRARKAIRAHALRFGVAPHACGCAELAGRATAAHITDPKAGRRGEAALLAVEARFAPFRGHEHTLRAVVAAGGIHHRVPLASRAVRARTGPFRSVLSRPAQRRFGATPGLGVRLAVDATGAVLALGARNAVVLAVPIPPIVLPGGATGWRNRLASRRGGGSCVNYRGRGGTEVAASEKACTTTTDSQHAPQSSHRCAGGGPSTIGVSWTAWNTHGE